MIWMTRRKTDKEFKQEVYDLVGDEYTVASRYKNARTKVNIIHNKCGYKDWWVTPHNFLSGKRCPKCSGNINLDQNRFNYLVNKQTNGEWYLSNDIKYKNNHTKVKLVHKKCNNYKLITPKSFRQNGIKCKYCIDQDKRNKEEQQQAINNKLYGGLTKKQFNQRKQLAKNKKRSLSEVKNLIKQLGRGDYELVSSSYVKYTKPLEIKHLRCNRTFPMSLDKFVSGHRCLFCKQSHGEELIDQVLHELNLSYSYGYILHNKLHLDFYLPQLHLAFEYDGIQHYKPREFFGGQDYYDKLHQHDLEKDRYCKEHGIKLVRIPYTVNKIKDIKKIISYYINLQNLT